ncbi:hypothetical protein DL95DRAFT_416514 [Leptodontidium sp. 2 PMI_412]|nr:hypothetical protein DL95DRAFT_416514 [Leptodontidium sp. 2 PMI_412]
MHLNTALFSSLVLTYLVAPSIAADCSNYGLSTHQGRDPDPIAWRLRQLLCGGDCRYQQDCTRREGGLVFERANYDGHVGFGNCWDATEYVSIFCSVEGMGSEEYYYAVLEGGGG